MRMTDRLPALFISHGAPSLPLEDCPARNFLSTLASRLPRPRAIVVMSAHYEAASVRVGASAHPETVHDFRGFPAQLYEMTYPAPGDPALAARIAALLRDAGIKASEEPGRGLDHGIWNPLTLVYPRADIPVVPLSILPREDGRTHYRIGAALAPLRDEGVLLIGSGSMTHNLRRFFGGNYGLTSPEEPFARQFADWVAERIAAGDLETLLAPPEEWPLGRENHPTDDHILPLPFALGAAGTPLTGTRWHASTNYGILAMDVLALGR
ncbi:DODA-type extradiol aromatic ring-opening family dioxygenase [Stappia indica]|uniref:DODA-type extradiol aromatic ring-opening family dioxygenase n=1 Tax=Stappia indica TaxID=538381 RepID=UPI00296F0E20|nr:class III extradiol ring-cleavage dioxygenase [Stappia indica]